MSYSSVVSGLSPRAFWLFEETSGTSAADDTGNSRTMTYAAGATLAQAGLYTGSTYSVKGGGSGAGAASIAYASGWMSTTAFTVGGWVTPTNTADIAGLFSQWGTHGWIVWQRRGKIGLVTQTSTQQESDGSPILLNKPTHIMVRLSSGVVDLFINGAKKATITLSSSFSGSFGSSPALELGRYNGGGYTNAKFDGFAYFDSALSDANILAIAAEAPLARDTTVKAWWKLDETSGTTMTDSSGAGLNGTYSGAILNQTALRGSGAAAKGGTTGQGVANVTAAAGSVFDTGEFTVIFNLNPANTSNSKGLITRWNGIGWLIWQSNSKISFYQEWAVGASQQYDGPAISAGTNRRVAVTVTTGVVKMYADGVLLYTWNPTTPIPGTSLPVQIGGYNGGNYSEAVFDDIKFYDVALTDAEVAYEFSPSLAGTIAGTSPVGTGAITGTVPTTGTVAGTSPTGTGAIVGTAPTTGTAAGTSPVGAGAITGTVATTGTVAGTSPVGVGSLTGTSDDSIIGSVAGVSPAGSGALTGTAPTTGTIAGASPAGGGSIAGDVVSPNTGDLAGTSPSGAGSLTGDVIVPESEIFGTAPSGQGSISGTVGDTTAEDATVGVGTMPTGSVAVVPLVPSTELDYAVPVMRKSVLAPVLSAEYPAHPEPGHPDAPETVESVVGYVHLWIDGQDVTYWRGGMTVIRRWESEAPFGDTAAAFEFPQRNPWDKDGEGDLSFLRPDAPVVIGIVEPTVGDEVTTWRTRRLWSGFLDASGSGLGEGEDYTYEAKGTLWQAQSRIREPHAIIEPVDIGVWVARVLNASEGRNWKALPLTPIGITTMTRGSRDEYDMEYVQTLLTEAITDDLRQWTLVEVMPGILRLVLKPAPSTVHATVAYGTPGVDIDLRVDQSTRVDRVFMRGWGPKMAGWANITYPHLEPLNAPAYPNSDTTDYLGLGTTDADTDSGTGVTTWQRRVAELKGFANPPVSGVMTSDWVAVIDDLQRRVGVTADGSLGPQTWNATFDRGVPDSEALTPRRLPMASKPWANHWLYSANGRILGVNPEWDSSAIVRDVAIDAGPGKTKAQGFRLARKILGRYGEAAANGTITWTFDPNETNRTRLSHLSNVKVLGYQGTDRVLQVASKTVELEAGDAGPVYVVTTRVDERARDAMAVEDLLEQRRSALPDPSRRPGNPTKSSRQVSDQRIPWDSESPCGVLRRTAVNGASGLWTVVTIPFAEVGKIASIRLKSDRPFAFAIFASLRITENKLASIVGNPFATTDPWRDEKGQLDEYGIIEAWGEKDNACGYSPKTEPDDGAFTGDFILDTPVDYWTETPPYVSVAIYMRGGSGWISGEFLPAYEV